MGNPRISFGFLFIFAPMLFGDVDEPITIEGVQVERSDRTNGSESSLALRGATDFTWRWIFDVYVAACYAPTTATGRLDKTWPLRLAFTYQRSFSGDDLRLATSRTIVLGKTPEVVKGLEDPLTRWNAAYLPVKAGDRLCIDRVDERTVSLTINGSEKIRVENAGFAEALMGIWLGPHAFDSDLKKGLTTLP
jgi:hypothetical protein